MIDILRLYIKKNRLQDAFTVADERDKRELKHYLGELIDEISAEIATAEKQEPPAQ